MVVESFLLVVVSLPACLPAYLNGWVSVMNVVLQVAHQHEVAGLVPARVQGVVVDVAEDGAGTDAVGAILGIDELAETVHDHGAVLGLALLLVLFRLDDTNKSGNHAGKVEVGDVMRGFRTNLDAILSLSLFFLPWILPGGPACVDVPCNQTCNRCA